MNIRKRVDVIAPPPTFKDIEVGEWFYDSKREDLVFKVRFRVTRVGRGINAVTADGIVTYINADDDVREIEFHSVDEDGLIWDYK